MNIFTDFFTTQLPSAYSEPGHATLRLELNTSDNLTIYMNEEDAKTYALAINRAKLQCLFQRLNKAKPKDASQVSSLEKH